MTQHPRDIDLASQHRMILQAWQCLIGDERVTYVSGPITTGLRWVEAVEAGAPAGAPIVAQNCDDIRAVAHTLRKRINGFVLEPASLNVEHWSQDDYLKLWTTLIERHAAAVAFVDGWPYSIGCAVEFERAISHGIPTQTSGGDPISLEQGVQEIRSAADDLGRREECTPELGRLARRLAEVATQLESRSGSNRKASRSEMRQSPDQ